MSLLNSLYNYCITCYAYLVASLPFSLNAKVSSSTVICNPQMLVTDAGTQWVRSHFRDGGVIATFQHVCSHKGGPQEEQDGQEERLGSGGGHNCWATDWPIKLWLYKFHVLLGNQESITLYWGIYRCDIEYSCIFMGLVWSRFFLNRCSR